MIWYTNIRPHFDALQSRLELFNEVMIMITLYIIVLYSKFNYRKETYHTFGYCYIVVLAIILFVNLVLMVYKTVKKIRRKLQLKKMKKNGYVEKLAIRSWMDKIGKKKPKA